MSNTAHFQAGAAQVDITPHPGIPLTGFLARGGPSTAVHDPLFARALAMQTGGQSALIISCDLLALDATFIAAARSAIHAVTAIPEAHILIACTHTHSGPATIFLRDCGEVSSVYLACLQIKLVEAALLARANLRDAELGAGRSQVNPGALNRRQPSAPIDLDLDVLSFRDRAGQVLAVLVNYACHPVCLDHTNRLISADYPGCLSRYLQEQTGAVVLFATGAAGDINPKQMGSFAFAEDLGQILAAEALRILAGMVYIVPTTLQVAGEILSLPLQALLSPAELEEHISSHQKLAAAAKAAGNEIIAKFHQAFQGWAAAALANATQGTTPAQIQAEIQVISLGVVQLVGVPGELFNQLGQAIKNNSGTGQVSLIGYANNDVGYIPTRPAYAQGGYEVCEAYQFYGYPAALAPEAGDLLLQSSARLLHPSTQSNLFPGEQS